jgi:putative addiction module component (TIGR02574 family)
MKGGSHGSATIRAVHWKCRTNVGGAIMPVTLEQFGLDRLTTGERLELIDQLWDSMPEPVSVADIPAWHLPIIEKRLAEAKANPGIGKPWREVLAGLRIQPLQVLFVLFCMLSVGTFGCSKSALDKDQARVRLKAQIADVRRAALEENHTAMADLTLPDAVKGMGGKDAFIRFLEREATDIKGKGFAFTDMVCEESSDLVESSGFIYSVTPYTLYLSGPENSKGSIKAYLNGVSADFGKNWVFLDGNEINGDRNKLKSMIPGFPDSIPIPKQEKPIWR